MAKKNRKPRPVPNWSPAVLGLLRPLKKQPRPRLNTELLRIGPRPNANHSNEGRRESPRLRALPNAISITLALPAPPHSTAAHLGYEVKKAQKHNFSREIDTSKGVI